MSTRLASKNAWFWILKFRKLYGIAKPKYAGTWLRYWKLATLINFFINIFSLSWNSSHTIFILLQGKWHNDFCVASPSLDVHVFLTFAPRIRTLMNSTILHKYINLTVWKIFSRLLIKFCDSGSLGRLKNFSSKLVVSIIIWGELKFKIVNSCTIEDFSWREYKILHDLFA